MPMVYDVCHNIDKVKEHVIDGNPVPYIVHRKGTTRAFPAEHPQTPAAYRAVGQPAIVGGSMGTARTSLS